MLKLKIDPEFQQKIPPLTEDEYRQLEENILKAGKIYNPIVTWNGFILDGHNRYKIWKEHPEIPEPVTLSVDDKLEDRWAALEWIFKNQLGRRNLNELQKTALIGLAYEMRKMRIGAPNGSKNRSGKINPADSAGLKKNRKNMTCEIMAEELDTTPSKIDHAYRFVCGLKALEEITPGITDKILSGETGASKYSVSEIRKCSPEERAEYIATITADKKPPASKKASSKIKSKKAKEPRHENTDSAVGVSANLKTDTAPDPEPDPDAPYLPDYTVKMFREELLANFTSFLETTENLLEWHKNLLVEDPKAKIRIMEVISFEINQLRKVRKDIDEKF